MASLPDVIGLLYRADWTRLSLSAGVRFEVDRDLLHRRIVEGRLAGYRDLRANLRPGRRSERAVLLIAPGGRYRLEYQDGHGLIEGNDGERGWGWWPGSSHPAVTDADLGDCPPVPGLFGPSGLLGGYTLELMGPMTACGRDAIAVAATPRPDAIRSGPRDPSGERVEVAVDAELGILFRRAETFGGQLLSRTELTALTVNPPVAADPGRFAPPPGSHLRRGIGESLRETFTSPEGQAMRNAMGLAAGGLGALIRLGSHLPGPAAAQEQLEASMPSPDPAPLGPADGPPPPDDLLYLLYRGGEPHDLRAAGRQWSDLAAMTARVPAGARATGHGGVGYLLDSATSGKTVARTEARLRVSGPYRYRLDVSRRPGRGHAITVACDGERRWQVFRDKTLVGPAAPLKDHLADLADASWLLRCRLSGGQEIIYRGRRARHLRVTRARGGEDLMTGPLLFYPADTIVDAETGCLLRLISYAGDAPACWWELSDISTEPGDPAEFRVDIPPGTRVVEETGNPLADAVAVMPGLPGTAARAAAQTVRQAASVVSATRSFLDDLRTRNQDR
jgi:hypothetical protein